MVLCRLRNDDNFFVGRMGSQNFHFPGEGNGNPLQCSCLENPRDRGACWAAIYGIVQSQIRLKQLSSRSSSSDYITSSWRLAGGTLSALFWCLCQRLSLSPLYFNKTLLHKSSERSSLITGPGLNSSPKAKNPGILHSSATTFQKEDRRLPLSVSCYLGNGKAPW